WSGVAAVGFSGGGVGAVLLGGGEDCCTCSGGMELSGGCVCELPTAGVRSMKKIKTAILISCKAFLPSLEYGIIYQPPYDKLLRISHFKVNLIFRRSAVGPKLQIAQLT